MNKSLFILAGLVLIAIACRKTEPDVPGREPFSPADTFSGIPVADTIIYEVMISNPNPEDTWTAHRLEGLNRKLLIDQIFELIYAGKISAFNHETGEKLTPKQVEEIEARENFSRDNIGMIQFTEGWFLNSEEITLSKEVRTMVLGYNYDTEEGERLHKALFRVEMRKE
jgi:hypothetical protein